MKAVCRRIDIREAEGKGKPKGDRREEGYSRGGKKAGIGQGEDRKGEERKTRSGIKLLGVE